MEGSMQLNAILEVVIGLVMTWLVVSATTSQIQEFVAELTGLRARFLRKRIEEMFHDDETDKPVERLYSHSLIRSLETHGAFGQKRPPADIPKQIFAQVVVELYPNVPSADEEKRVKELKEVIGIRRNTSVVPVKSPSVLKTLMPKQDPQGINYPKNVEDWFDAKMSEASKMYRKNVAVISFLVGLIIAVSFNVDSIHIADQLWKDPTLRQAIVVQAENVAKVDEGNLDNILLNIDKLALPIGYGTPSTSEGQQNYRYLGWLVTALAASQGAPFWFDILRNLTGLKKSEPTQKQKTD
jgi:hypothetical protein